MWSSEEGQDPGAVVATISAVGSSHRREGGDWDTHSAFQGRDKAGLGE